MATGTSAVHLSLLLLLHGASRAFSMDGACVCNDFSSFNRSYFVAVWNFPAQICYRNNIPFDLEAHGIITDKNGDLSLNNDLITILYSNMLGQLPYYEHGLPYFGGLPQLGNLERHLEKVEVDIDDHVPDREFSGLIVIDYENWHPVFDANYDNRKVYQTKSVELVKARLPYVSDDEAVSIARTEFESAAKDFFLRTLLRGQELRPAAKWGFYGFPDCHSNRSTKIECNSIDQAIHKRMSWLFVNVDVILPSGYLQSTLVDVAEMIRGRIEESHRIVLHVRGTTGSALPVMLYIRTVYEDQPSVHVANESLRVVLQAASKLGADGVILWGSSMECQTVDDCWRIKKELDSSLFPNLAAAQAGVSGEAKSHLLDLNICPEFNYALSQDIPASNCDKYGGVYLNKNDFYDRELFERLAATLSCSGTPLLRPSLSLFSSSKARQ